MRFGADVLDSYISNEPLNSMPIVEFKFRLILDSKTSDIHNAKVRVRCSGLHKAWILGDWRQRQRKSHLTRISILNPKTGPVWLLKTTVWLRRGGVTMCCMPTLLPSITAWENSHIRISIPLTGNRYQKFAVTVSEFVTGSQIEKSRNGGLLWIIKATMYYPDR